MKARTEVEQLKTSWYGDPCWDIEDTEGFEEYREELVAYSQACNTQWQQAYQDRVYAKAAELGIADHPELAAYILKLEERLTAYFSK